MPYNNIIKIQHTGTALSCSALCSWYFGMLFLENWLVLSNLNGTVLILARLSILSWDAGCSCQSLEVYLRLVSWCFTVTYPGGVYFLILGFLCPSLLLHVAYPVIVCASLALTPLLMSWFLLVVSKETGDPVSYLWAWGKPGRILGADTLCVRCVDVQSYDWTLPDDPLFSKSYPLHLHLPSLALCGLIYSGEHQRTSASPSVCSFLCFPTPVLVWRCGSTL